MFLAVRSKALQRLEDALVEVEQSGGDVLTHVQELTVAEREAARSLGVEWRRFTWVRDQVGRLLTTQRQREDQRVLLAELTRAKQDLSAQLEAARDSASRQFLEAQLKTLNSQLEKLDKDQRLPTPRVEEMKLLESARAEIATLQGRQDRVQRRLQELLQRAAQVSPSPVPTTPADR
jgi:chromosome segregation ATPase